MLQLVLMSTYMDKDRLAENVNRLMDENKKLNRIIDLLIGSNWYDVDNHYPNPNLIYKEDRTLKEDERLLHLKCGIFRFALKAKDSTSLKEIREYFRNQIDKNILNFTKN